MVKLLSIYDASVYGSPDPAGLTYDPVTGQLLLVDSEVDEKPFFSDTNMFSIGKDGTLGQTYTLTTVTKEPTGVAYNSVTDTFFITDDDANRVYEVSRDDPTVVLGSFSTTSFGSTVEDIAVAPDGTLYILDEASRKIWHTGTDGTVISSIQLPSSLKRPEALAYDPREDVFYVAGGWSADIFKVNSSGEIIDKITVLRPHRNEGNIHVMPKALTLVPSDDPNGAWQLWVGDYGADQVDDGRLFVIELDAPPPPPQVSVLDASPAPQTEGDGRQVSFTITLSEAVTEDVVVTFDTVDGTALAGSDYVGVTGGTAVIAAGTTTATVLIDLVNDNVAESEETFSLLVREATKVTSGNAVALGDTSGTATLVDDDTADPSGVRVYDTTVFGSPDPSALTYVSTWGRVILADSEVDEKPFFSNTNLFELGTDGTFRAGINLTAITKEPTGVAHWFDATGQRDLLFVTDDDAQKVYVVDMADLSKPLASFSTTAFGCSDPEDVAVDPNNGHLYIVGESSRTIYETTQDGTLVATIVLPSTIKNPEAVAYDERTDTFYVSGFFSNDIFRVSREGAIVETIKTLRDYDNVNDLNVVPKGLTLVPDGNGGMYLWVADYGVDQVADGRILTIHLPPPPPPSISISDGTPSPQTEQAGVQVTFNITLSQTLTQDVTVTLNTVDGTALAGEDYVPLSGATATIAAGRTSTTVAVDLMDDDVPESQETFNLEIASALTSSDGTAVEVTDGVGVATVLDDDSQTSSPVLVYDTTVFGSTDPSGLTYVSTWGRVILSDSEVTEEPFFSNINLFELGTDGTFQSGLDLTAITKEATGVAHWFDATGQRDLLFVTDDDAQKVYVVDMADLSKPLASFSTTAFGCSDPEDVAVDPNNGHLYIVGESSRTIYETTQEGTLVSTIVLSSTVLRPEAVAYDASTDTFYVSGYQSNDIFHVSRDGAVIETITALDNHDNDDNLDVVPKGLALVPDDSGGRDLWVADYGLDQVADGRLFVIDLDDPATLIA